MLIFLSKKSENFLTHKKTKQKKKGYDPDWHCESYFIINIVYLIVLF